MQQHDFPSFMRLPPEVRCRIWWFALPQRRVHRLRIGPGSTEGSYELHPTETLPRSTVTRRILLSTCVESRIETMRAFPDVLPLARGCLLRFNKDIEVICLAQLNKNAVERVAAVFSSSQHRRDELIGVANVQNLAIELRNTSFIYNPVYDRDELDPLARFLATFKGLQWLFLVPRPLVADPETVSCPPSQPLAEGSERQEGDHVGEDQWSDGMDLVTDDGESDTTEEDEEDALPIGSNTQAEGDSSKPEAGDWLRGENGLGDWYRWVPDYTPWHSTDVEVTHFIETATKAGVLEGKLRNIGARLHLTENEKAKLAATRVEVMIHLREGVEPIYDL